MLDIIIPVYNEEKILTEKRGYYFRLKNLANVIFVDGGSQDNTAKIAERYGRVVHSRLGRGYQKNRGVQEGSSPHLLFLHVDVCIEDEAIDQINQALSNGVCAGCFKMKIADKRLIFRIYEIFVNFRARYLGIVDGDLGFFIKREVFQQIGQFDELPVLEDLLIGRKLKRVCSLKSLNTVIQVSSRKWQEQGFLRTFMQYTLAYLKFWNRIVFQKRVSIVSER